MASPSQAQLQSDAKPTGVVEPHSNVSNSSASDHSNILPDPVQLERELAHEALNRDLAPSKPDDHLKTPTIGYEEALQRELEYQKRIKMVLLQRPAGTGLNVKPSKKPPLGRSINQQPLKQQPYNKKAPNLHEAPIWCNLCKVNCVTTQNLMSHTGGKKHKARMDQAMGRKKVSPSNGAGRSRQAASSEHKQGTLTSAAGSGSC